MSHVAQPPPSAACGNIGSPEEYRLLFLGGEAPPEPEPALPFLPAFRESAAALSAWEPPEPAASLASRLRRGTQRLRHLAGLAPPPPPPVIRGYLRGLLRDGSFTIRSPRTGAMLRSGGSLLLRDKSVWFCFPQEPDLLLAIANLGGGFPVSGLLVGAARRLIVLDPDVWAVGLPHLPRLAAVIAASGWSPAPAGPPRLVLGDPNFAHHAWNQLPGLLAPFPGAAPDLVVTHEPIGRLPDILPRLRRCAIARHPVTALEGLNGTGHCFVPVGTTRVPRQLVTLVLAHAARQARAETQALLSRLAALPGPVIWISLRTRNRTATNQAEFLGAVCQGLLEAHPGAAVLLDGHSAPADLAENGDYDRTGIAETIAGDRALAESLRAGLPAGRVFAAIGLPVPDSLLLAQRAAFYVCHHGTVQHKIGWFSSTPGVVHTNPRAVALDPAPWVAAQSELAVPPVYLPAAFVEAATSGAAGDPQQQSMLHEDYRITDIPGATGFILRQAKQALS